MVTNRKWCTQWELRLRSLVFFWICGFKLVIVGLSVFFTASHTEFPTWYVVAVTGPESQPQYALPSVVLFYDAARRVTVDPGDRSKGSMTQNYLVSISDSQIQTVWFRVTDLDFFACKTLAVCFGLNGKILNFTCLEVSVIPFVLKQC